MKTIAFILKGAVRGGKNNMKISRNGHHYPSPAFAAWRDDACWQLIQQLRKMDFVIIKEPVSITVNYIAGDRRIRDVPAILDALWHVLGMVGIVNDDCLLGGCGCSVNFNFLKVDKKKPGVQLLLELKDSCSSPT